LGGETILVVDDEEDVRDMIAAYLEEAGYRTILASDGEEAVATMDIRLPHIVMADVNMPHMNGLQLAQRIRASPVTAGVPILILSALSQPREILSGYSSGADDYVTKPVELAVLLAKIEALLKRSPAPAAPPARRVIVFLHAKGGVGATTVAVNVAVSLASSLGPARVCLLDVNRGFGSAAAFLALTPASSLADVLSAAGGQLQDQALDALLLPHASGIRLLVAGRDLDAPDGGGAIGLVMERLRDRFDYVLADIGVGLPPEAAPLLKLADVACVVTSAGRASLEATAELLRLLEKHVPEDRQFLVLDRTTADLDLGQAVQILRREPASILSTSELHVQAADSGQPLVATHRGHGAAIELERLAGSLKRVVDTGATAGAQLTVA
jgi:DNA-binding response OmpR family regulator